MRELKYLYDKFYVEIDDVEYEGLIYDSLGGYMSLFHDVDLEELLNYFIEISPLEIQSALYNGTLTFYKWRGDYIAVLES